MQPIKIKTSLSNLLLCYLHSERLILFSLVLASFLVRIIVMMYFHTYQFPDERSVGYEMGWIAWNIVHGEGFKVGNYYAWMAPLYPFIMSQVFRVFGSYTLTSVLAILVMQSFVSSLVVIPLYFIGKRLFSKRVGFIAAVLWIFHPAAIYYAINFVWSSTITSLGIALIVLIFLRLADKHARTMDALLGGIIIGIVALSDPVIMTFFPLAVLWLLWRSQNGLKKSIGQLIMIGLTVIVLLLPWTLRNYRIFHQFVPIKSTFGVNLWQGNYSYGIDQRTAGLNFENKLKDFYSEEELSYLSAMNEVERDKMLRKMSVEFIRENPETFTKYTLQRIYLFWRNTIRVNRYGSIIDRLLLTLIPLTIFGVVYSWRHWRDTILMLLILLSYPVVFYVTHADFNRFRFPIEELMLVFVAQSVYLTIKWARPKRLLFKLHNAELAVRKKVKW